MVGMTFCFIVLYTLVSISGNIVSEYDGAVYIHCTQTVSCENFIR